MRQRKNGARQARGSSRRHEECRSAAAASACASRVPATPHPGRLVNLQWPRCATLHHGRAHLQDGKAGIHKRVIVASAAGTAGMFAHDAGVDLDELHARADASATGQRSTRARAAGAQCDEGATHQVRDWHAAGTTSDRDRQTRQKEAKRAREGGACCGECGRYVPRSQGKARFTAAALGTCATDHGGAPRGIRARRAAGSRRRGGG